LAGWHEKRIWVSERGVARRQRQQQQQQALQLHKRSGCTQRSTFNTHAHTFAWIPNKKENETKNNHNRKTNPPPKNPSTEFMAILTKYYFSRIK